MNVKGYFKWILREIDIDPDDFEFYDLFWHLYSRRFTWSIPFDENRAADGIGLRSLYLRDGGVLPEAQYKESCTVLEMMVALSIRCEKDILGNENPGAIMWEMIGNLGLDVYDYTFYDEDAVDEILEIWLLRRFDLHGNGGPFPVKKVGGDQKKADIWRQMCSYLNENYGEELTIDE